MWQALISSPCKSFVYCMVSGNVGNRLSSLFLPAQLLMESTGQKPVFRDTVKCLYLNSNCVDWCVCKTVTAPKVPARIDFPL
uniref:Uncharacterized protein n=1 Tax=Anguilla anguilla TaxID=7936 RepID=A0A0E9WWI5_ANGAN